VTVVMFGTVVCIMVVALSLIAVVSNAYGDAEPPVAGFDLRADLREVPGSPGGPIRDIEAELSHAPAISRAAFGAIGGVTMQDVQLVQLDLPAASWQASTLAVVDDGFLQGIQSAIKPRVAAYHDNASVWAALRERPGTAVVSASLLSNILTIQGSPESDTMSQVTVWIRPNTRGRPVKLAVIGVVDPRSELDEAIYTSRTTAARLGISLAAPSTYFFAVRPAVRVTDVAEGLRVSFGTRGLAVVTLGDTLRLIGSVRLLLTRLVQSFMALGLVAGIAALGLLGLQSVLERRQHLGTLRALGFTRWQVRSTLALESAVVAVLGITLGVGLGLILTRSFVAVLAASYPEVRYAVPWKEIALTASTAWLGSTLSISLAAWDAGRVSPADALRVV
jgi:putative ABC transport system permease protein